MLLDPADLLETFFFLGVADGSMLSGESVLKALWERSTARLMFLVWTTVFCVDGVGQDLNGDIHSDSSDRKKCSYILYNLPSVRNGCNFENQHTHGAFRPSVVADVPLPRAMAMVCK
jgi:hypothetical protein